MENHCRSLVTFCIMFNALTNAKDSPSYHCRVVKTVVIMISETVIMYLLFLLWKVLRFFLLVLFLIFLQRCELHYMGT